ncbi:hypothetical protein LINPERHAP2_LOCUS14140, partial [Linum perenne]
MMDSSLFLNSLQVVGMTPSCSSLGNDSLLGDGKRLAAWGLETMDNISSSQLTYFSKTFIWIANGVANTRFGSGKDPTKLNISCGNLLINEECVR